MKKAISTLAVLALLSLGLFAADKDQTFTGTVSDTMCGARHTMMQPDTDCIRACVQAGSDYALVVGTKVYTLKGDKAAIDKFAAQPVTVTGKLSGNVIQASSIAAAKK